MRLDVSPVNEDGWSMWDEPCLGWSHPTTLDKPYDLPSPLAITTIFFYPSEVHSKLLQIVDNTQITSRNLSSGLRIANLNLPKRSPFVIKPLSAEQSHTQFAFHRHPNNWTYFSRKYLEPPSILSKPAHHDILYERGKDLHTLSTQLIVAKAFSRLATFPWSHLQLLSQHL